MTIYEMTLEQLEEYNIFVHKIAMKYEKAGETLLCDLISNKFNEIDDRIQYLKEKNIWDMILA